MTYQLIRNDGKTEITMRAGETLEDALDMLEKEMSMDRYFADYRTEGGALIPEYSIQQSKFDAVPYNSCTDIR